jgi:hypothetical protein
MYRHTFVPSVRWHDKEVAIMTSNRSNRPGPWPRAATLVGAAVLILAAAGPVTAAAGDRVPVYRFADGSQVGGAWSSVAFGPTGASLELQTSDLPAGHTVTVWWVVFNEPENCSHPEGELRCGPGDLPVFGGDDSAVTSLVYAAGHQIGGSGQATFAGRLAYGDASSALWGPGLVNPAGADIHLVVHDLGLLSPQQIAEGIHDYGPCDPACVDVQYSPHQR